MKLTRLTPCFTHIYPKIIFLDFDGVLSNGRTYFMNHDTLEFDPVAVKALNSICEASGAKIVCVSSRTYMHSRGMFEETKRLFGEAGLDIKHMHPDWCAVVDVMKDGKRFEQPREDHIANYLKNHPEITHWVHIDDEVYKTANLVKVDENEGISYAALQKICKFLEVDSGEVHKTAYTRRIDRNEQLRFYGI